MLHQFFVLRFFKSDFLIILFFLLPYFFQLLPYFFSFIFIFRFSIFFFLVCGGVGDLGCKRILQRDFQSHMNNPYCRICYPKALGSNGNINLLLFLVFVVMYCIVLYSAVLCFIINYCRIWNLLIIPFLLPLLSPLPSLPFFIASLFLLSLSPSGSSSTGPASESSSFTSLSPGEGMDEVRTYLRSYKK